MTKTTTDIKTKKSWVQISLSQQFHARLKASAEASGRSLAAQLEHWSQIARVLEAALPGAVIMRLKAGELTDEEIKELVEGVLRLRRKTKPTLKAVAK